MALFALLPSLNEAMVWSVKLQATEAQLRQYAETLSPDEQARANRFLSSEIRDRFIVCRAVLRAILGELLNIHPSQIQFHYEQWGKPTLRNPPAVPLHFNVSHSGNLALIAISRTPIGVDIEVPNERINLRAIHSQIMSPTEATLWEQIPPRERQGMTLPLWVCKEALLKAMGLGIAEGLRRITFPLPLPIAEVFHALHIDPSLQLHLDDDGTCRTASWIDAAAWQIRVMDQFPHSIAAIATSSRVVHIEWREYPTGQN